MTAGLSGGQVLALASGAVAVALTAGIAAANLLRGAAWLVTRAWRRLAPGRRHERLLDALQEQMWPEGEWADLIRAWMEDS